MMIFQVHNEHRNEIGPLINKCKKIDEIYHRLEILQNDMMIGSMSTRWTGPFSLNKPTVKVHSFSA